MRVPGGRLANVSLPEWGIEHRRLQLAPPAEAAQQQHGMDPKLADRVRAGKVRCVVYTGYGRRIENFPDLGTCRNMFRTPAVSAPPIGPGYLACPLGSGDEPDDSGAFYPLTPAE